MMKIVWWRHQSGTRRQCVAPHIVGRIYWSGKWAAQPWNFIHAARDRGDAMDHALLHGPPGLGKTTLAQIIAAELGVGFRATSGPVVARAGDLARF